MIHLLIHADRFVSLAESETGVRWPNSRWAQPESLRSYLHLGRACTVEGRASGGNPPVSRLISPEGKDRLIVAKACISSGRLHPQVARVHFRCLEEHRRIYCAAFLTYRTELPR